MASIMYVCFECKKSRRYRSWHKDRPRCQFCSRKMMYAFYKFEMPAAKDNKGWGIYREKVIAFNKDISEKNIDMYRKDIDRFKKKLALINKGNHDHILKIQMLIAGRLESIRYYQDHCNATVD